MAVAHGVLVAMALFPASLGAEYLVATVRSCLLAELAKRCGKLVLCHLRDPLRCRLAVRAAGRGGSAVRPGGGPGSGMQSH
jgi:hypothetical protein